MLDKAAKLLDAAVRAAIAWAPKQEPDIMLEDIGSKSAKLHPTVAQMTCGSCIFLNASGRCENFKAPRGLPARQFREDIPIARELCESMFCTAWLEVELAKLLLLGIDPSRIDYSRRHPEIVTPRDGAKTFAAYLASVPRMAVPEKSGNLPAVRDSGEEEQSVPAKAAPPPKRSNKTIFMIAASILGFVILCTILNLVGNSTGRPISTPTIDTTAAAQYWATSYVKMFGHIFDAVSGQAQQVDCRYGSVTFQLANGDSAFIPCPADTATLTSIGADQLPAALGDGLTFVSAMDVQISPSLSGTTKITFSQPEGTDLNHLTILHWDGAKWENLGIGQLRDAQASTAGVFVLASK